MSFLTPNVKRVLVGYATIKHGVKRESLLPVGTKKDLEECFSEDVGIAQLHYNLAGTETSFCVAIDFFANKERAVA